MRLSNTRPCPLPIVAGDSRAEDGGSGVGILLLVHASQAVGTKGVHDKPALDMTADGALGGAEGSVPIVASLGNLGPGFFLPP